MVKLAVNGEQLLVKFDDAALIIFAISFVYWNIEIECSTNFEVLDSLLEIV